MATVQISQRVAVLVDGNNIERSIIQIFQNGMSMIKFDTLIPKLLGNRELNRLVYFREGENISSRLGDMLHAHYHGSVQPCHKTADIPLTIKALQLSPKVDTIIIMSGDSDFVELVRHLKSEGVRVEIASVEETTAKILRDEADHFHPLAMDDCFGTGTLRAHDRERFGNVGNGGGGGGSGGSGGGAQKPRNEPSAPNSGGGDRRAETSAQPVSAPAARGSGQRGGGRPRGESRAPRAPVALPVAAPSVASGASRVADSSSKNRRRRRGNG